MAFGTLHTKCVSLTSKADTSQTRWHHLLTLPRLMEVLRRFYKAHPLLKPFLQKEIPSLLAKAMEQSHCKDAIPSGLLRHMVLQIAAHQHAPDLEVREWAALCQELLDADQSGLRCCEYMWHCMETHHPEWMNALRMYSHATLSECNKRGAFVRLYDP